MTILRVSAALSNVNLLDSSVVRTWWNDQFSSELPPVERCRCVLLRDSRSSSPSLL